MLYTLFGWDIIVKIALNTLLVSIPEEAFLVMFTLILAGKFDFLDTEAVAERGMVFHKSDLMRILVPVIASALLSNVLRYAGVDFVVFFPLSVAVTLLLIVGIYRQWNDIKEVGKILLFLITGVLIIATIEFSYIPFVMYSTGKTISETNNHILWNFLIILPERLVEAFIILLLLTKKATFLKANLIKPILKSRVLFWITLCVMIFNFLHMGVVCKVIGYDRVLASLELWIQLTIIIFNFLFPVLNISALLWGIYYKTNQKHAEEVFVAETVGHHIKNLRECLANGNLNSKEQIYKSLDLIEREVKGLIEDERGMVL